MLQGFITHLLHHTHDLVIRLDIVRAETVRILQDFAWRKSVVELSITPQCSESRTGPYQPQLSSFEPFLRSDLLLDFSDL